MSNATEERPLPPLAKEVKKLLRKTDQLPEELAKRLGRDSAQGLGRAFSALVERGIAEKTERGGYKKATS